MWKRGKSASSGKGQSDESDRSRVVPPTRHHAAADSAACRPPTQIDIIVPHMHAFITKRKHLTAV